MISHYTSESEIDPFFKRMVLLQTHEYIRR